MAYTLLIPSSVKRDVKRLDKSVQRSLRDVHFPCLKADPRVGERLKGDLGGLHAYHFAQQGKQYRIAYQVNEAEQAVVLVMVGTRGEFYEALRRRLGMW
jgi:mRNA-degrading endonuclease RelE of RelBE toxin-antitoxin system